MAALRDLLEVYGALDEAAAQSGNPDVAATLDEFLPGSSENTGWYREVENFFSVKRPTVPIWRRPARIGERAEAQRARTDCPAKQRLFYGLTAAARISPGLPDADVAGVNVDLKAALVPALAAVGPGSRTKERVRTLKRFIDGLTRRSRRTRELRRRTAMRRRKCEWSTRRRWRYRCAQPARHGRRLAVRP